MFPVSTTTCSFPSHRSTSTPPTTTHRPQLVTHNDTKATRRKRPAQCGFYRDVKLGTPGLGGYQWFVLVLLNLSTNRSCCTFFVAQPCPCALCVHTLQTSYRSRSQSSQTPFTVPVECVASASAAHHSISTHPTSYCLQPTIMHADTKTTRRKRPAQCGFYRDVKLGTPGLGGYQWFVLVLLNLSTNRSCCTFSVVQPCPCALRVHTLQTLYRSSLPQSSFHPPVDRVASTSAASSCRRIL
jgi:hypothetical protein